MPAQKKPYIKKAITQKPIQPKGPFHFTGRKFNIIFILSVIGLCFALYGSTIPNQFSLDDEFVIHDDSIVAKGVKGIPQLFKNRYAHDQKGDYGYRPIVKVSFALEYALFKASPHWGHVINILLYAFVCIFLFFFFRKLLYNQWSDYFLLTALLLFITHPIHSEVVASLKNRDEMLVCIFGFYTCYAMLKWFEAEKILLRTFWGISGCLSLGLGVLCKPDALIFIPVTAIILYFFSSKPARAAITSFVLMTLPIFVGYRLVHKRLLPHTGYQRSFTYIENPLVGVHWYHKIPLAFSTVWFYIGKMIFPKDLVCYYGYDAFDAFPKWMDFSVIAGLLLSLGLLYLIIKNIKKKSGFLFVLLLFAGTAFPYTDIFQVGAGIVAERFMFIPSIFFIFLVTYLLYYILKIPVEKKPFGKPATYLYVFLIGVCLIFTVRILVRNPDWKTHQSIYLHDSREAPRSAKLQSLLGATYVADAQQMQANQPSERATIDTLYLKGQRAYQQSIDIYPGYGTSLNNLGMIVFTLYGNAYRALDYFNKALKMDSDYVEAWFNRGTSYEIIANKGLDTLKALQSDSASMADEKLQTNESREVLNRQLMGCKNRIGYYRENSEKSYLQTIKLKPTYYMAYIYIARLYSSEKQYDKIIELDSNAIKSRHISDPIYVTLANAYLQLKDSDNAVLNYEKSTRYFTRNYYVNGFLASYFAKHGDMEKARYYKQMYDEAMSSRNGGTQ